MKPFNLEAALQGKPVVTRDGRKVKIAGYNPDADINGQLVGWVDKSPRQWYPNGTHMDDREYYLNPLLHDRPEHHTDLFMAAEEVTVWVNVYGDDNGFIKTEKNTYYTKEDAETSRFYNYKYLGAYPLTIKR